MFENLICFLDNENNIWKWLIKEIKKSHKRDFEKL